MQKAFFTALFFCMCASPTLRSPSSVDTALHMLGESSVERCPICAEKLRIDAFKILNKEYFVGKIISSNQKRFFQKSTQHPHALLPLHHSTITATNEEGILYTLPTIIFRYHTSSNHYAGIDKNDFTEEAIASRITSIGFNTPITAKLKIISFKYGNGDAFFYSARENTVTIHCKVIEVEQAQ